MDATIQCIETEGIQGVTTRGIAEIAGVNSAAINYYFRSKDLLVEEAMKKTVGNAFEDWDEALSRGPEEFFAGLRDFLSEVLAGAERYPNLTKAHLFAPFLEGDVDSLFARRLREFLVTFRDKVRGSAGDTDDLQAALRVMSFVSAVFFPAIMPGIFRDMLGADVHDPDIRASYIDFLMRSLFGDTGAAIQ